MRSQRSEVAIMVLEPNPEDLYTICSMLEHLGVSRVLCVEKATDALRYLMNDKSIDLLVASEKLPDSHGKAVIERARSINKNLLCVLCDDTEELTAGLEAKVAGATDFIRKKNFKSNLGAVLPYIVHRVEVFHRL